jgi:serine phosphatase RsbU (regulator of sigma subunit)
MENINYQQEEITLEKGDKIFLYTDGITESINKDEEFFGEERIGKILNQDQSIEQTLNQIKTELDKFSNGLPQFDDITMLILEYKG